MAKKADVFGTCVYTIHRPEALEEASRSDAASAWLRENRRWASVPGLLQEAWRRGQILKVLFADARDTRSVIFSADLDAVVLDEKGTRFRFRNMRPVRRMAKHSLILDRSGRRLAANFIRPYALCRTPKPLLDPTAGEQESPDFESCRSLVERGLPEARDRRATLSALAASIRAAHRRGPSSWGISHFDDFIRLNVGPVEVFTIAASGPPRVMVSNRSLKALELTHAQGVSRTYRSVNGRMVSVEAADVPALMRMLRPGHLEVLSTAASVRPNYNETWRARHSQAVLEFLQEVLGRRLPTPAWFQQPERRTNKRPGAYLLTWNPKKFEWNHSSALKALGRGARPTGSWRCANGNVHEGDRLYFMRVGPAPRGVFASALAISGCTNGVVHYALDALMDLAVHPPLGLEQLAKVAPEMNWTPQASGIGIDAEAAIALARYWTQHQATWGACEDQGEVVAIEGTRYAALREHRTREQGFRDKKLASVKSLACEVKGCGFDFERIYGPKGKGFAIVHHKRPLASRSGSSRTRLSDLAIVCANCHAMIHRDLKRALPLTGLTMG